MGFFFKNAIFTGSVESLGLQIVNLTTTAPASTAWPSASDALFVPFTLCRSVIVTRLFSLSGATITGSVDIGIYDDDGNRIVSSGNVNQTNVSGPQFFDVTDFDLVPGRYYFALAKPNNTGTFLRTSLSVLQQQQLGIVKQAAAYPLPATATFVTATGTYVPWIGAEIITSILV